MIIIMIIGLGYCLGFALRIRYNMQTPQTPRVLHMTKPAKHIKNIDVNAIQEELTFLEVRCQNLIELLDCIDLMYGESHDTKKQAQLIQKRMSIDQQYYNAMKKRYKLERILQEYNERKGE